MNSLAHVLGTFFGTFKLLRALNQSFRSDELCEAKW